MKQKITVIAAIAVFMMFTVPALIHAQGMEVTSAKVYLNQQDNEKAREMLEKALAKDPDHKDANFYMGMLKYYKGEYTAMLDHWDKFEFKKLGKREKKMYESTMRDLYRNAFNKAVDAFGKRDWDNAVTNFKVAIRVNPEDQQAPMNLGLALMNADKTDEAIEVLEKVAESDPKNASIWDALSLGYIRNSDYPNIIKSYSNYLELAEQPDKMAYYQLARAYFATGDTLKAAEAYESGIEKVPDEMDFYIQSSAIRSQFGQNDKAAETLQRAHELDPENADVMYSLGTIYYILKDFQKAVVPLQGYVDKEPLSIDGWDTLGNAYYGLANQIREGGDAAKATEYENKGKEFVEKSKELMRSGEGK